jgi:hypothetical protein
MPNNNVATFPYASPSDAILTVASDNAETTLTGNINSSVTSIAVTDASGFSVPCLIVIDTEVIRASGKSGDTFTGCTRGFSGSTAVSHTAATGVFGYILAYQHNQVAAEIKSVSSYVFNSDLSGFKKSENLLSYSEDFSQGYWAKASGVTVAPNSVFLPNGSAGTTLLEGTSSGYNMISGLPTGISVGATYTFSVYLQFNSVQWMLIGQNIAGSEQRYAWFDVQNGAIGTVGTLAQAAIVPISGGWYRCMIVTQCTNNVTKTFDIALVTSNGGTTYVGTATDSNYICGAQVRGGNLDGPHTYIKTSGVSFSLTGSGDLILDEGDLS